ncbi:aldehyde dehydrogenase family protein [Streptosporangium lutulentum]
MFEYAPAPESRDIIDIKPSYGLFINGEWVEPLGEGREKTVNPASEEVLAEIAVASEADVDRAVQAARKAFTVWSAMPGSERAKYIFRIARIIQERARELAVLESLDNGKPIRESRDVDLPLVAAHFFYYAGWADKLSHAGFGPSPGRWAWRGRSSRGTSRCSCWRGRSRPRWPAGTRSSSSPPRPRR